MQSHVQELREISMNDAVKGKHFFLETDIKGPALKLDNTGKATLTVSGSYLFDHKNRYVELRKEK